MNELKFLIVLELKHGQQYFFKSHQATLQARLGTTDNGVWISATFILLSSADKSEVVI
jgi:hypothetical protein